MIIEANTKQKERTKGDLDLIDKQATKEKIIKNLDDFEKDFRENLEAKRELFASAIKEFSQKNNTDDIKILSWYAQGIINTYADKIIKTKTSELSKKLIAKEVP